jgi:hypothetical protein
VVLPYAGQGRLTCRLSVSFALRMIPVVAVASVLSLTVGARPTTGQSVTEPAAKAAFLLNFARFTQWPVEALLPGEPLTICASDRDVADALEVTVRGREAGNRAVAARRIHIDGPFGDCDVLYVTRLDKRRAARLLESVLGAPVLTVSDEAGFAGWGGDIELFIEDGRMGFLVNRKAAERVGVRLSSRLLGLARFWKD